MAFELLYNDIDNLYIIRLLRSLRCKFLCWIYYVVSDRPAINHLHVRFYMHAIGDCILVEFLDKS